MVGLLIATAVIAVLAFVLLRRPLPAEQVFRSPAWDHYSRIWPGMSIHHSSYVPEGTILIVSDRLMSEMTNRVRLVDRVDLPMMWDILATPPVIDPKDIVKITGV